MPTTIGKEETIDELVRNLLCLEHDAIAACDETIAKLKDAKATLEIHKFRADHLQHVGVLEEIAKEVGLTPPTKGDMKRILTTGKIKLASLVGDSLILKAMKTNEDETVTAYEQAFQNPVAAPKSKAFFEKALEDERRHRAWMSQTAEQKAA